MDLRHVNNHIPDEYIGYEDWRIFKNFLTEDGWLYKFDLSSGYHHLDVHEDSQKKLGFSWDFQGKTRYFVFTVLPFGLKSAPRIFTKTLRPLSAYWKNLGIQIAIYLDDGGGTEKEFSTTVNHVTTVKETLIKAGFVVNQEKSVLEPTQNLTWLGVTVDTTKNILYVSDKRINKCQHYITHSLLSSPYTTARKLAKFVGMIISMKFVIGDIVNLKTRFCYQLIESRIAWDSPIKLFVNNEAIDEVFFWKHNLSNLNVKHIKADNRINDILVHSDASNNALGVVLNNDKACHRNLNDEERGESSTYRELLAVVYGLQVFQSDFQGKKIEWFVDNYPTTAIVHCI